MGEEGKGAPSTSGGATWAGAGRGPEGKGGPFADSAPDQQGAPVMFAGTNVRPPFTKSLTHPSKKQSSAFAEPTLQVRGQGRDEGDPPSGGESLRGLAREEGWEGRGFEDRKPESDMCQITHGAPAGRGGLGAGVSI